MATSGEGHRTGHRVSEASRANLRPPWKPGESGNPGGCPKGRSVTALLRERLKQVVDEATRKTFAQLVVDGWLEEAIAGNIPAVKEILDRTEGKVPDHVVLEDERKAYVTENPDTLCPPLDSDPNSEPTNPTEPPVDSGETSDPRS